MRIFGWLLVLVLPVLAQPALTFRLKGPVSFPGVVERPADGRVWLRTPEGERVVVNDELAFTDASHQLLEYATLAAGTSVVAELSSGELRLVSARDAVATLLGPGGPVQVPLRALAPQVRSEATVPFRRTNSTTPLPLAEAMALQAGGQGLMVLPELGLAQLKTPQGRVVVNLKPELTFTEPLHLVATLQRRSGDTLHMVARSSGDSLAAPLGLCQAPRLEVGDAVNVDVPAGSYQLMGMFGRQAQLATPHGLLQLPFRLLPESVLTSTEVSVRTYGGEVRALSLQEALRDEKTQSYMLLLLGRRASIRAPSPASTTCGNKGLPHVYIGYQHETVTPFTRGPAGGKGGYPTPGGSSHGEDPADRSGRSRRRSGGQGTTAPPGQSGADPQNPNGNAQRQDPTQDEVQMSAEGAQQMQKMQQKGLPTEGGQQGVASSDGGFAPMPKDGGILRSSGVEQTIWTHPGGDVRKTWGLLEVFQKLDNSPSRPFFEERSGQDAGALAHELEQRNQQNPQDHERQSREGDIQRLRNPVPSA